MPDHLGRNCRLVDEDEARRIKLDCSTFSSARAAATSGRSCSARAEFFFERDVVAFVERQTEVRTGFQPFSD